MWNENYGCSNAATLGNSQFNDQAQWWAAQQRNIYGDQSNPLWPAIMAGARNAFRHESDAERVQREIAELRSKYRQKRVTNSLAHAPR